MKLLESNKGKITKDKNAENVNYLKFNELVSIHCLKLLYIEVWFTDRNSNLLEIEDKINITLVIN